MIDKNIAYEELYKGVPVIVEQDDICVSHFLGDFSKGECPPLMVLTLNFHGNMQKEILDRSYELWAMIGKDFVANNAKKVAEFLEYDEIPNKMSEEFLSDLNENFEEKRSDDMPACLMFALETQKIPYTHKKTLGDAQKGEAWEIITTGENSAAIADDIACLCLGALYRYKIGCHHSGGYIGPESIDGSDDNNIPEVLKDARNAIDLLTEKQDGGIKITYTSGAVIYCNDEAEAEEILEDTGGNEQGVIEKTESENERV